MAKALIFLAEGYEEVEMLTVVDMVRRAKIDIDMVAIGDQRVVKSSHGVCITADRLLDEADFAEAQMLILPGGIPGTPNLRACDTLCQQLQQFAKEEKWVEEISLKAAIDRLSQREHRIIELRYFEGKTQMEVAQEIQISQAQVSRLEKRALKSMKNYLT